VGEKKLWGGGGTKHCWKKWVAWTTVNLFQGSTFHSHLCRQETLCPPLSTATLYPIVESSIIARYQGGGVIVRVRRIVVVGRGRHCGLLFKHELSFAPRVKKVKSFGSAQKERLYKGAFILYHQHSIGLYTKWDFLRPPTLNPKREAMPEPAS
jgi:hypothetical protein